MSPWSSAAPRLFSLAARLHMQTVCTVATTATAGDILGGAVDPVAARSSWQIETMFAAPAMFTAAQRKLTVVSSSGTHQSQQLDPLHCSARLRMSVIAFAAGSRLAV